METIAVYIGNTGIYWSSIVIVLGVMAGFCLAYAIYTGYGGRGSTMFAMQAFSLVLSVLISRFLHFYSHQEQYDGLFKAITDYSGGSFFFPGVILGVMAGAAIGHLFGYRESVAGILDATAPGLALTFAIIRLSALFTTACRGRIVITTPSLQRLPIGSAVTTATGTVEYRFATFFVTFIVMLPVTLALVIFYYRHHRDKMKAPCSREGHVWRLFLVLYSVTELVLDSTRNDSTFPHFSIVQTLNRFGSFVSLTQLFAAVALLIVFIYYSRRSVKANGAGWKQIVLWVLFAAGLAATGISEYLVQRHGDMYKLYYSTMTGGVLLMAVSEILMYVTCRARKKTAG